MSQQRMEGMEAVPGDAYDGAAPAQEPLFNIGAVARQTGISVVTLRMWERRYGFPSAARTDGGQRIYSPRTVQSLRWVKARMEEGMQVGNAVRALRLLAEQDVPTLATLPAPGGPPPPLGALRRRLVEALRARDLDRADRMIGDALAVHPVEALVLEVLRPALADLGEGWSAGEVDVATEHLATHYVRQRLIMWLASAPAPRAMAPIALACAPGEWHDASLLMFGVLLRRRHWPVTYLGQALPLADLARFVAAERPAMVAVVAMRDDTAAALVDWPLAWPPPGGGGPAALCYGGRAFTTDPTWRERVAGTYLGDTLEQGVATVEGILGRNAPAP